MRRFLLMDESRGLHGASLMRLHKFMAECGVASRRKSEELIASGAVTVNGERAQIGQSIDPASDTVKVKGRTLCLPADHVYIMLNKPGDCASTCSDEKNRKTVLDYLPKTQARVFPVGRLDFGTEGLLLLTNDGELANGLMHPRRRVQKKYLVVIDSDISDLEIRRLEAGITIDGYKTAPAIMKVLSRSAKRSEVLCIITEGKNRQLRRMFDAVGKHVVYMKRVGVGNLALGNLKRGHYRYLTSQEIDGLRHLAGT